MTAERAADLPAAAQRVQDAIRRRGLSNRVHMFADTTRSSAEAAAAVGCGVAQIAKSIVFCSKPSQRAVLIIASGVNRVDERKVATLIGEAIGKADADFVRNKTGFVIGGVPPLGHDAPPVVLIDRDLFAFDAIWAAAGAPNAVFPLTPAELVTLSGGQPADVKL